MTGSVAGVRNAAALEPWYGAVRGRANTPANAWVFADSIGEGVWVSAPIYQNRWLAKLQTLLRAWHPTPGLGAGGVGFMPAYYADALISDETTRTGGGTFQETSWIWGPGGRCLLVPGTSTGTVTYPAQTITSFRVWYGKNNFLGGQGAAIVDGVTQVTTMNGSAAAKSDGHFQDYTVTPGSHTVAVKCTTAGSAFPLNGVQFFNGDETRGIQIWDATHSGMNATHLTQSSLDPMYQLLGVVKPRLIMLALGTNDRAGYTVGDYLTNIAANVSRIATAMSGVTYTLFLIGGYEPGAAPTATPGKWAQMMAGLSDMAVGNVAYASVQPPWPELRANGSTNAGLMFEASNPVHLTSAGATLYAEVIADALRLPESRRPSTRRSTYLPGPPKVVFS